MGETFIINENRLFAPVRVGQIAGYAYVDTGARYSAILQSYAKELPQTGSREFRGALGKAVAAQVHLDEFSFLGTTYRDVTVDVRPDSTGGLDALPFQVIMAFGCDVLLQKLLHLDFMKSEIGFLEDSRSELEAGVRIEADFSFGQPFFKMALGAQSLDALFDTGAALSVLNQRLLAELKTEIAEDEPLEAEDPTGAKLMIPTFRCRGLHIGDVAFDECQVFVFDLSTVEREANVRVDFVFGINAMMGKGWVLVLFHKTDPDF